MRVVITAEAWPRQGGGAIAAPEVAAVARDAWEEGAPTADPMVIPVGDGGPRTADALAGPVREIGGAVGVGSDGGLVLAPARGELRWDPIGLGVALLGLAAEAERSGARPTVVVPVGDEPPAGDALDLWGGSRESARASMTPLALIALTGSSRPLLGFRGLAAETMAGREADPALARAAQEQESRWAEIAGAADAASPTGALVGARRLSDVPGSGAAGGLAYALGVLGARLAPGAAFAAELAGVPAAIEGAGLVVAIGVDLTPRGLEHGTIAPASAAAGRRGIPCVAIAPAVEVGRRDRMAAGLAGAYECGPGAAALADRIRRVARMWTPRR